MSSTTVIKLTHSESAAQMADLFTRGGPHNEAISLGNYFHALAAGTRMASVQVSVAEASGVAAVGTITISGGSGTITAYIDGVAIPVTWGTSDTATGTALAAAINASTDSLVSGIVSATAASGVVTVSCVDKEKDGNTIQLAATGTGVTVSVGTPFNSRVFGSTQASGTLTISSGSGSVGGVINGVTITATWATSDTVAAAAVAAAINASANALISGIVTATSALGVVTVKAVHGGTEGNAITLTASGTGVTASGARLTGGVDAGTAATGTNTISGADGGTYRTTINGVNIDVTGTNGDDTATAVSVVAAVNGSTNALVRGHVTATNSAGVVTLTSVKKNKAANAITLAVTGTGATASGARLTGGVDPKAGRLTGGVDLAFTTYNRA